MPICEKKKCEKQAYYGITFKLPIRCKSHKMTNMYSSKNKCPTCDNTTRRKKIKCYQCKEAKEPVVEPIVEESNVQPVVEDVEEESTVQPVVDAVEEPDVEEPTVDVVEEPDVEEPIVEEPDVDVVEEPIVDPVVEEPIVDVKEEPAVPPNSPELSPVNPPINTELLDILQEVKDNNETTRLLIETMRKNSYDALQDVRLEYKRLETIKNDVKNIHNSLNDYVLVKILHTKNRLFSVRAIGKESVSDVTVNQIESLRPFNQRELMKLMKLNKYKIQNQKVCIMKECLNLPNETSAETVYDVVFERKL